LPHVSITSDRHKVDISVHGHDMSCPYICCVLTELSFWLYIYLGWK